MHIFLITLVLVLAELSIAAQPWQKYIYSPKSRNVAPVSIHSVLGDAVITSGSDGYVISMNAGAQISLDFGVEVGGLVSFTYANASSSGQQLSMAFAESPSLVRSISDDTGATPTMDWDKALNITLSQDSSTYTVPKINFRGGFRFVTLNAQASVTVSNIKCEIGFSPAQEDLRDYSGYFYTSDSDVDILNKIWYAGAYTVQTNIAPQGTGRWLPQVRPGWAYNNTLGVAGPILLDGAKRDRAVWPGDMGISGTTGYLSLGDVAETAVLNALETLFYYQNATGEFPFAGPDTGSFRNGAKSNAYHAWSLIAIYNYAIYTADDNWLNTKWDNITRGVDFIMTALANNSYGLQNQTATNDWARQGGGGYNSALNALDYHAITSVASLPAAIWPKNSTRTKQAATWVKAAAKLKASYNKLLWDSSAGLYRDNQTTNLHPQDGNAIALLYGLTESSSQASSISQALLGNWNSFGPVTPELPDTISPFVSSIEVLAHFQANQADRAYELIQRLWTYMLESPLMTGSTLVEGITANGSLYYRGNAGYAHDAAYTSLSHGWSSGPTQALSNKAAGLEISGWKTWTFAPQPGTLSNAKTGYWSGMGSFAAEWQLSTGRSKTLSAYITTPSGTTGSIKLPFQCSTTTVNGKRWTGGTVKGGSRIHVQASGCK